MKKLMYLLIMCAPLVFTATATDYEDIAELIPINGEISKMASFDKTGDYCFATSRDGTLNVFDVSDIFNLTTFTTKNTPVTTLNISGQAGYGQAIDGDYLYTSKWGGLVVDVSNPLAPSTVGSFSTNNLAVNLITYDHPLTGVKYLICVEYTYNQTGDVEVYDISNPTTPVWLGAGLVSFEAWSLAVYNDGTNNYLYVGGGWSNSQLAIYDFNNPANIGGIGPTLVSLPSCPYHLKVVGDKLVTSGTNDTYLFDLSAPLAPVQLDAEAVKGRVCAQDDVNIIYNNQNNGDIYKVDHTTSTLEPVQTFDNHGSYNGDGFPFGSDVIYQGNDGKVALAFQNRVLILRTKPVKQFLSTDISQISEFTGGVANLTLDATVANKNRPYLIFGSVTGTSPGITLPGGVVVPVNWDAFTNLGILLLNTPIFSNFSNVLDSQGQAKAAFDTLGPISGGLSGLKIYFAYGLDYPHFASNYVTIEIIP